MKLARYAIFLMLFIFLAGCSSSPKTPDLESIEADFKSSVEKTDLFPYIEALTYGINSTSAEDVFNIDIEIKATEEFAELKDYEINDLLEETADIIQDYNYIPDCGKNINCTIGDLKVSSAANLYEVYLGDYFSEYVEFNGVEYEKYRENKDAEKKRNATESTKNDTQSNTRNKGTDPADFNGEGEYKPVEDMTQEEIEAELESMLEDSLGQ